MTDYDLRYYGSVNLLVPQTDAAREHIGDAFPDAIGFGSGIAVEPRYSLDILYGLLEEGFSISWEGREIASMAPA